jgi:hypothetical protein
VTEAEYLARFETIPDTSNIDGYYFWEAVEAHGWLKWSRSFASMETIPPWLEGLSLWSLE